MLLTPTSFFLNNGILLCTVAKKAMILSKHVKVEQTSALGCEVSYCWRHIHALKDKKTWRQREGLGRRDAEAIQVAKDRRCVSGRLQRTIIRQDNKPSSEDIK